MTDTSQPVRFISSRFGELEIPEQRIISVPEGIIGFPDYTRYALLDPSGGRSLFLWLQAVDAPDLAFIITDPHAFVPDYRIEGAEPDLQRLGIGGEPSPAVFVIVAVPPDNPNHVNANLAAPLVYIESDNTLFQIVLEHGDWPLKHYLIPEEARKRPLEPHDDSGEVH